MKYIGSNSLSSTMVKVLKVAWVLVLVGSILPLAIALFFALAKPNPVNSHIAIKTVGMAITFSDPIIDTAKSNVMAIPMAMATPLMLAILYIITQLRHVFDTFAADNPFHPMNHLRIRRIGLAIIASSVFVSLTGFLVGAIIQSQVAVKGLTIEPRLGVDIYTVFVGIVVMVLAEVFHVGTRIKEDNDLTV